MKYNETDNPHPRGFIGMIIANHLIDAGWEEEVTPHGRVWRKGDVEANLEFAYQREFQLPEGEGDGGGK